MKKEEVLAFIKNLGIVPVLRADSADEAVQIADAIIAGGINCLEVTMTVPGAISVIEMLSQKYGDRILIGAGTVLNVETAQNCIDAGAQFLVTPCLIPEVIKLCNLREIAICAGALTPTEVFAAWQAGADVVKVFPASAMGGASYLKALKAPFPNIEIMPTGGVSLENIAEFLKAGVVAVGVGGELVSTKLLREGNAEEMTKTAQKYLEKIEEFRLK